MTDIEREIMAGTLISSTFALSMIAGRSPELLAYVLAEQLSKYVTGNNGDIDLAVRREHLFNGLAALGAAGLPILVTSTVSHA